MSPEPSHPIGVFDSGVGGLSVLREIRHELPAEALVYVADSGFAPYGDKPTDDVRTRAEVIAEFLLSLHAKALVVACNTATGAAADALRDRYHVPIIAIEPAVKPAAARTRSRIVGVIATTQTLSGQKFTQLVETYASGVKILSQPCPGLMERVETGDLDSPRTLALIDQYVRPLVDRGADTIVLGCTHYPFLTAAIRRAAGPDVTVIDSSIPVARQLRRRLEELGLRAPDDRAGTEQFWTTGIAQDVRPVVAHLWSPEVTVHTVPAAASAVSPRGSKRVGVNST